MEFSNDTWKLLERHPDSSDYEDVSDAVFAEMVEGVNEYGVIDRKITIDEGKVLDGWQLLQACIKANVKPTFAARPDGVPREVFVKIKNDLRRHESEAAAEKRINDRRRRVAAKRAEGQSLRSIAKEEGVSKKTIENDIEASRCLPLDTCGDGPYTPEPNKVTGRDGKTYPAAKPAKPAPVATRDEPPEPDDMICDDDGNPVPAKLRAVFAEVYLFNSAVARLAKAAEALVRIEESPFYQTEGAKKYSTSCRTAEKRMIGLRPSKVCCGGGCDACGQKGYLTTEEVDHAPVS
jgi:hypothetical protein